MEAPEGGAAAPAPSLLCSPLSQQGGGDLQSVASAVGGLSGCQCLEGRALARCQAQEPETLLEGKPLLPRSSGSAAGQVEGSPPSPTFPFLHRLTHSVGRSDCTLSVGQAPSCPWGPAKLNPTHTAALCILPVGCTFLKLPPNLRRT